MADPPWQYRRWFWWCGIRTTSFRPLIVLFQNAENALKYVSVPGGQHSCSRRKRPPPSSALPWTGQRSLKKPPCRHRRSTRRNTMRGRRFRSRATRFPRITANGKSPPSGVPAIVRTATVAPCRPPAVDRDKIPTSYAGRDTVRVRTFFRGNGDKKEKIE